MRLFVNFAAMKRLFPMMVLVFLSACRGLESPCLILPDDGEPLCWMTALADDTPLTQLSIPGAHDAASASVTSWTRWTRTQALDIDGL